MHELTAECVFERPSTLGEGPCWDPARQGLLWVDIEQKVVCFFDPASRTNQTWSIGSEVGFAIPTTSGDIVCGTRDGIVRLDRNSGAIQHMVDPELDLPRNRFNDGKCDPQGRLWAGTLSDDRQPVASLYRIDGQFTVDRVVDGVTVSNGMAWSRDQRTMYYIDSPTYRVDAFDYHPEEGTLSNRRPVIKFPEGSGKPDGMTIDAEGMLWVALYRGHSVTRWNPETSELLARVKLPAANVTSCCFGGQNLDTLYITCARAGLDKESLEKQPLAGSLFSVQSGVEGMPITPFAG